MADVDFGEAEFVPLAQVYGRYSRIFNERGEEFVEHSEVSWSEIDLVQATARQPGARAWYLLDERGARRARPRADRSRELVARGADAHRLRPSSVHGAGAGRGRRSASPPRSRTRSAASESTSAAASSTRPGRPVDGLYAAGADAGGISTGGYASGLASALVLGRIGRRGRALS